LPRVVKDLTHAAAVPFVQDELDYEYTVQSRQREKTISARKD
jgi:hypothetical protein